MLSSIGQGGEYKYEYKWFAIHVVIAWTGGECVGSICNRGLEDAKCLGEINSLRSYLGIYI